jgi:two-component SAPR family response regulator
MAALERKVKVLILESSKAIAAGLVNMMMGLEEIEEILYAPTFDKPIHLLLSGRVDIVLCSLELTDENVVKLTELQSVCKPFSFIVLFKDVVPDYTKKHPGLSVDHFLDTGKELEKLPETISRMMPAMNKVPEMSLL